MRYNLGIKVLSMRFSEAEIQKLAQLAKLRLNDTEAQSLAGDLEQILDYIEQLKTVPVLKENEKIGAIQNWRADCISAAEPETVATMVKNFPQSERGFVKFKKIHKHE